MGGAKGDGFKIDGDRFILTNPAGATFSNLILPFQAGGELKLTFHRLPTSPKLEYGIDVEQLRPVSSGGVVVMSVVGGVSYEIHADRDGWPRE